VNLKSRFPEGIVADGQEYDRLRDEIAEKLERLVDPDTGQRVVARVFKREELYHGDALNSAPDLLVTWKDFEYNTRRGYGREVDEFFGSSLEFSDVSSYSSLQKSGTHHIDGILIANGPWIKNLDAFQEASITDLAPTVLYLLGETIPEDMDGRVIEEIIQDGFVDAHPIHRSSSGNQDREIGPSSYSESEEAYIKQKLQGLGYID
jgi:predicted AlkP superfamily phosphohydrolase/phosphomutase